MSRWVTMLVSILALSGCGDGTPELLVRVETDLRVPVELDELEVEVVAAREGDRLCEPWSRLEPDLQPSDFPYHFAVRRGRIYTEWVALRVTGRSGGDDRLRRYTQVSWPGSGVEELRLELERGCLGVECARGEQCLRGECEVGIDPAMFDDAALRDAGLSCHGDAPAEDE